MRDVRAPTAVPFAFVAALFASVASPASAAPDRPAGLGTVLVQSGDASYGIASGGGNPCIDGVHIPVKSIVAGCGAIVRYDASGISIAHLFVPSEGASPVALRAGSHGSLYGVTTLGGKFGHGTTFRFDPATKRLAVLESLPVDVATTESTGQTFAALDDGSVISENQDDGTFSLVSGNGPNNVIYHVGDGTVGTFAVGAGNRAVFLIKAPDACDTALVALDRLGHLETLVRDHKAGAAECATLSLTDALAIHATADGSFVANDSNTVYVAKPGSGFAAAYVLVKPAATSAPTEMSSPVPSDDVLVPDTAILGADGDIVVAMMHRNSCGSLLRIHGGISAVALAFDGKPLCVGQDDTPPAIGVAMPFPDGIAGAVAAQYSDGTTAFVAGPNGKITTRTFEYPARVEDLALDGIFTPATERTGRLSGTWDATGSLSLPELVVDPTALVVEMTDVDSAHPSRKRLPAHSSKSIAVGRIDMTMEKYTEARVAFGLDGVVPGRYEFVTHAANAVRSKTGAKQPIVNDGGVAYWLVTALDLNASSADPELTSLRSTFDRRPVSVVANLPLQCTNGLPKVIQGGSPVRISTIVRVRGNPQITGFGPAGDHIARPGDARTQNAPFFAIDPLTISFQSLPGCDTPDADFASSADVRRYLQRRTGS